VVERKRWPIIRRTAMPMIFRLEAAFDHHLHLESTCPSWPLQPPSGYWLKFLTLVRTWVAFKLGWEFETAVYASAIILLRDDHDRG